MTTAALTAEQLAQLRAVAATLIPGSDLSPAAAELTDLDELLERAAVALGSQLPAVLAALATLPAEVRWEGMAEFASADPAAFELVSTLVAGAYFMSTTVLKSIGYPTGPRSAPPFDLAADELATGILEPVIARGSVLRAAPHESVSRSSTGERPSPEKET
ncbi:MAG TPA: hypothetical protein VMB27_13640 [Solirubrobacteraceae bacterium]|nr:hypothetical protein [Solirubrobacteraceae bacterium]